GARARMSGVRGGEAGRASSAGRRAGGGLGGALAAAGGAAERAAEAEEGPAHLAGIALRCPLFPAAGAAPHGIVLLDLGHATSGGEVVTLDLVDQRGAGDAQLDGRAGAVAGMVHEGALDVLALEVFEAARRMPPVADTGAGA